MMRSFLFVFIVAAYTSPVTAQTPAGLSLEMRATETEKAAIAIAKGQAVEAI